jgi:hypothetical protein
LGVDDRLGLGREESFSRRSIEVDVVDYCDVTGVQTAG